MSEVQGVTRPSDVSLVGGPGFYEGAVTPESLYLYLSSRLQGLDEQIDVVFKRQEKATEVRGFLNRIQSKLAKLENVANENPSQGTTHEARDEKGYTFNVAIDEDLKRIESLDPKLGAELRMQFNGASGILNAPPPPPPQPPPPPPPQQPPSIGSPPRTGSEEPPEPEPEPTSASSERSTAGDVSFTGSELKASQETVKNMLSDLEASASLDMIRLQSSMSSRQTAVQLATNLTASLSESLKSITGNIGR